MSTRSVIARKTQEGFRGVYHHWDGYPSGLGKTLFEVRNRFYQGDTKRMLKYLIDDHSGGWSTINKDWTKPAGQRPDENTLLCQKCGQESWRHYRQYYKGGYSSALSDWERAGRPEPPEGSNILVLGHSVERDEIETGPEPHGGKAEPTTEQNASAVGCEWAYVFDGDGKMEIQSSYRETGGKMIGAFGCGDPKATWKTVAIIDLDAPEPNWEEIES